MLRKGSLKKPRVQITPRYLANKAHAPYFCGISFL
jgi:hypothetical protein